MIRTRRAPRLHRVVAIVAGALTALAVAQQLSRPRGQRTWQGHVVGVPYDFRLPTAERFRQRLWAPDNPCLVVPRVFGVGWTLNLGRLLRHVPAGSRGR